MRWTGLNRRQSEWTSKRSYGVKQWLRGLTLIQLGWHKDNEWHGQAHRRSKILKSCEVAYSRLMTWHGVRSGIWLNPRLQTRTRNTARERAWRSSIVTSTFRWLHDYCYRKRPRFFDLNCNVDAQFLVKTIETKMFRFGTHVRVDQVTDKLNWTAEPGDK